MTYNLSDAVVYGSEVCFDEKEQIKSFHNKFFTNKKHPVKMKWNCFIPAKVQTDVDIHRFLLHIFDLWFIFLFLCLVTGNISMQHDLFHFLYFKNIFLSLLTYLKTFNAGVFSHEDHCTFTPVKDLQTSPSTDLWEDISIYQKTQLHFHKIKFCFCSFDPKLWNNLQCDLTTLTRN